MEEVTPVLEEKERSASYKPVFVTEITDDLHFYVQDVETGACSCPAPALPPWGSWHGPACLQGPCRGWEGGLLPSTQALCTALWAHWSFHGLHVSCNGSKAEQVL